MEVHNTLRKIRDLLKNDQVDKAIDLMETMLPPDQAEILRELPVKKQHALLARLEAEEVAEILEELEDLSAAEIAAALDIPRLASIIDQMDPDEAADLLGDLEPEVSEQTLEQMETSAEVRPLMVYGDQTAGGVMTSGFITFMETETTSEVLARLRQAKSEDLKVPYIFVVNGTGALVGIGNLLEIIRTDPKHTIGSCMRTQVLSVRAQDDREKASRMMARYALSALPVVDDNNHLLGIITFDDAMDVMEEEITEDIFDKVALGTLGDREMARSYTMARGPVWKSWRVRMPFLIITLFGGMLAGVVIDVFEDALKTITVLAFFIPVVMGMGGNVGTQSSTIFTRAFVLGHINPRRFYYHVLREIGIGLGMGIILGFVAGLIVTFWQPDITHIGLVVGLALAFTVTLAATLGYLLPFSLVLMGLDQTAGAVPLMTMIKDVTGLLIYFLLAYTFLGLTA